ncbi:hypothetical protein PISL3812_09168 [Talaromyces islandicus]|uniref:2EXR domain-containing protein n=1 Tax=Talaromyces islandicus TaxID=28573 RepID=A0A0U1M8Z1_TALIS|nr:hypothetical protein PISL3812_09168 [Talaromyces islandicus]
MAECKTFHLFPKLPAELRLEIWRLCLPQRVCEKDQPYYAIVFHLPDGAPSPCLLYQTTEVNGRPPVVTRVCRESRAVAWETGLFYQFFRSTNPLLKPRPSEAEWRSYTSIDAAWFDSTRDSMHLNWEPSYGSEIDCDGSVLRSLAWDASQAVGGGSLCISYFKSNFVRKQELVDVLKQLPIWKVIMRVIVIHTDSRTGASTGLFGLLGDSRVQLVDVFDESRINAFFDLAEHCEPYGLVTVRQQIPKDSAQSIQQKLRDAVMEKFRSDELLSRLRPVIMFRLCTEMCNRVGSTASLRGLWGAKEARKGL